MKIKALILGAAMAVAAFPAMADGYNRVTVSYENESYSSSDKDFTDGFSANGFGIEYTRGFGVASFPLYIEAGLKATFGFHNDSEKAYGMKLEDKFTAISLNIPVNVAYRIDLGANNMSVTPYTGLNFRVRLTAQDKVTISDEDDSQSNTISWFDKDEFDPTAKRFQMGWNIGARFNYGPFGIGLGYTLDFMRFYNVDEEGYKAHISTGTFHVGLSYTF
ncbi:MAG: outer membrane beta-barrel protein [[Clostridium] fimetarium]|nr:outer membrane beta-barrel protein [Alistipes timonensis]MCM1406613.1 outer membrane beta-barrel protein [[Clostridium] fimetarium]